ncbi:hypothetical protein RDI58_000564 [Solanum bulbocastanum]
MVDRIT